MKHHWWFLYVILVEMHWWLSWLVIGPMMAHDGPRWPMVPPLLELSGSGEELFGARVGIPGPPLRCRFFCGRPGAKLGYMKVNDGCSAGCWWICESWLDVVNNNSEWRLIMVDHVDDSHLLCLWFMTQVLVINCECMVDGFSPSANRTKLARKWSSTIKWCITYTEPYKKQAGVQLLVVGTSIWYIWCLLASEYVPVCIITPHEPLCLRLLSAILATYG